MPWSTLDETLFGTHLQSCLAAVESALAGLGFDQLVIEAGQPKLFFLDDQYQHFRANPWFTWLVPAAPAPGSLLQIRPGHRPRLLFVTADDYWHSPAQFPADAWTSQFEIEIVPSSGEALAALQHTGARSAWVGESPSQNVTDSNPTGLLQRLEQQRCRKSAYETACLREASRIGVRGHRAAEQAFRAGAAEFDIHLAFLGGVRQAEPSLPYPPIIALNAHAATLHYQLRDMQAPGRHLSMLIDAGAGCRGYASDITRTWSMGPGLFAALIDGMHALQQDLCERVAPGTDWPALHLHAHLLVARLLREAGILMGTPESAVESGVTSTFLPHGLGHLLGLQVHDVGGLRSKPDAQPLPRPPGHESLRLTRHLEAGMVVTVEPGIYFIDSLLARLQAGPHKASVNWRLVDNLRPWGGIRIEDDVVVTASGHENLTRIAFADVTPAS